MLNKFTVLACYCLYFSKSASEYARMFVNVANAHRTIETDNEIAEAAKVAMSMMGRPWVKKKSQFHDIQKEGRKVRQWQKELEEAQEEYKNAEWNGGQLHERLCKDKIKKLQKKIKEANEK